MSKKRYLEDEQKESYSPSKKRKLDNNTSNRQENNYDESHDKNKKTIGIAEMDTNEFKYEQHPTIRNTEVISLISDDDDTHNDGDSDSDNESSSDSASSELYEIDAKGYLKFTPGLLILGKYKLVRQLGKGTFSRVFECIKGRSGAKYAVKVIRNGYKYQIAAQTELEVLRKIKTNDTDDKSNCIKMVEDHKWKGHPIILFPLLGRSVYSFMVTYGYKPFCYDDIIHIMWQLIVGLEYVHRLNIIITDLKPENIVLVNDDVDETRLINRNFHLSPKSTDIKLIDFGSAVIHEHNAKHTHLIQTRHYRAPEVVFKLDWTFSADLWSVGCILVELIHGKMLFNTHCSIDHINQMVKCINAPPSELLELIDDETWDDLFDARGALNMYKAKRSPVQCKELRKYFSDHENEDCQDLHDLAKKLLVWNPKHRITAKKAKKHQVFKRYKNNNNNNNNNNNKIKNNKDNKGKNKNKNNNNNQSR